MSKSIIRIANEYLPIDDMWNIVSEVGQPPNNLSKDKNGFYDSKEYIVVTITGNQKLSILLAFWHPEEGWWYDDEQYPRKIEAIAWMELPRYKI